MRIISRGTLKRYWEKRTDSEQGLKTWYSIAKAAQWASPADIKRDYRNTSILKNNRVCFNIGGNAHRLIVKVNYRVGIIFIRFIGSHSEYDKINVETI